MNFLTFLKAGMSTSIDILLHRHWVKLLKHFKINCQKAQRINLQRRREVNLHFDQQLG